MADQPTRSGADSGPPAGDRPGGSSGRNDSTPAAPLTVSELLARSGTDVRRRRAERRESADATGRQQPVRDDGRPDRPPLRGGIRRGPAAAPNTQSPAPEDPPARGFRPPPPQFPGPQRPARPSRPPQEPPAARWSPAAAAPPSPAAPPPSAAVPPPPSPGTTPPSSLGSLAATPPPVRRGASPAGLPAVPPRPSMRAVPADGPPPPAVPSADPTPSQAVVPAPRVVAPASVTPAAPPSASADRPSADPLTSHRPATPYPSVPVPGVRRSLPLPPIPGRNLPAPGSDDETTTDLVPVPPRLPAGPVRRRLTRAALALLALLGLVAAYYVGLYFYVDQTIHRVDALVTDGPEILAPQLQESAQTYLVVAPALPGRTGLAAVSTLIAHVSADGQQAVLVSVPPTALSDTPTCRGSDGDVRPAVTEPFADALLDGGPSCLVRSVQQLTGLRVDHYLALDLHELPGMVNALGDIPVCLPAASTPAGGGPPIPAGVSRLTGNAVAAYLQPGGADSDVTGASAAQREQLVLTSTLRTALAGGTVADPLTLTRFLSRAANAFTVDADTTLGDLRALGATLGDLPADAVQRTEVPVAQVGYVPAGTDQAAVVLDATATRELFDAVIDNGRLPAAAVPEGPADQATSSDAAAGTAAADSLPEPVLADPVPAGTVVSVAPAGVTVDVLDATGGGRTTAVADGLAAEGFRIAARGVEPAAVDRTVVRYGPAALEPARTVAAAVPGAVLLETAEVGGDVQLVIGPDYTGLTPVGIGTAVPATAAPAAVDAAAAGAPCS